MLKHNLPRVPSISVDEVADLVDGGALLLDIREANEWAENRIGGAQLRPLSLLGDWWRDLPRDRTVVLYCRSGNRSAHATNVLIKRAHYDNVLNLSGGILAWKRAGLSVETT